MPFAHRHREQEEAYVVVGGSGRANLDGEIVALAVWDVLRVAPTVVRSFEAGPEGLDLICIGGRQTRRRRWGDDHPTPGKPRSTTSLCARCAMPTSAELLVDTSVAVALEVTVELIG